jgi:hypothetical protein
MQTPSAAACAGANPITGGADAERMQAGETIGHSALPRRGVDADQRPFNRSQASCRCRLPIIGMRRMASNTSHHARYRAASTAPMMPAMVAKPPSSDSTVAF